MWLVGLNCLTLLALPQVLSSAQFTISDPIHHCCTGDCGQCQRIRIADDICLPLGALDNKVSSINTHDTCVNIWDHSDCTGDFKIIKPGSDCEHWNLGQCGWGNKISSISACSRNTKQTFSNPANSESIFEKKQCIPGTYVKEIRLQPNSHYGMQLECFAPGRNVPSQALQAAQGVTVLRQGSTKCDAMVGLSINFRTGEVVGKCEYDEEFNSDDFPFTSLCANIDSAVCGVELVIGAGKISSGMPICCDVPNPGSTCQPSDRIQIIKECDNSQGSTPLSCHYDKSIGIVMLTSLETLFFSKLYTSYKEGTPWRTLRRNVHPQHQIQTMFTSLISNFAKLGYSNSTGCDWSDTERNSRSMAEATQMVSLTVTPMSFTVSPGHIGTVEQVVGECGSFRLYTNQTVAHVLGRPISMRASKVSESNSPSAFTGTLIAIVLLLIILIVLVVIFAKLRGEEGSVPHQLVKFFKKGDNDAEIIETEPEHTPTTNTYNRLQ